MSGARLSREARVVLATVRRAGEPVTTESVRQAAGLSYERSLDALAELLDAGLVGVEGDDSLEVVYLSITKGAA